MREMELVTAAAAVDDRKGPRPGHAGDGPKHAVVHTECLNCAAPLQGRYCYACGQGVDDHHRSILHLVWEVVQDFTHLDGRLMQTIPPLFLKPGQLARDHFEGRRMRHVPPLRLFLITLLIFMAVLEFRTSGGRKPAKTPTPPSAAAVQKAQDDDEAEKPARAIRDAIRTSLGKTPDTAVNPPKPAPGKTIVSVAPGVFVSTDGNTTGLSEKDLSAQGFEQMSKSKFGQKAAGKWLVEHGQRAMNNKQYFRATMFEWGHRLSILMLPIFAGFLALCYFYKRQFYVYDHLIVAMHFLSFTFLIWAVAYLIPDPVGGLFMLAATIWTPVNLFMTLRGAYGSSVLGAVVKTFVLWIATLSIFIGLLLGVIFVAMGSI